MKLLTGSNDKNLVETGSNGNVVACTSTIGLNDMNSIVSLMRGPDPVFNASHIICNPRKISNSVVNLVVNVGTFVAALPPSNSPALVKDYSYE